MKLIWEINEADIKKLGNFIDNYKTLITKNNSIKNENDFVINRDTIIKTMLLCLLQTEHNKKLDNNFETFFKQNQFLFSYTVLLNEVDIKNLLTEALKINGLTKYVKKIPDCFSFNFYYLENTNWELQTKLENAVKTNLTKQEERSLADSIDKAFKGFGSEQARRFLQVFDLAKYEIPIDYKMIDWLKKFGFPIKLSRTALQDKTFYHFISDAIQLLCEKVNVHPSTLAAIITLNKNV
ncbi:MAG: hypothetical protein JST07_06900 [Bacteroidetes bacterium]|nr:hypothetical protein [Bacteroidota bacterium]